MRFEEKCCNLHVIWLRYVQDIDYLLLPEFGPGALCVGVGFEAGLAPPREPNKLCLKIPNETVVVI